MMLLHKSNSDAVLRQELNAGGSAKIIINGMPQMEIRVNIGPAKFEGFEEGGMKRY